MTQSATTLEAAAMQMHAHSSGSLQRTVVIGLTAFLTVVDLFATQAILPSLTRAYGVSPAAMGFAVNSSTIGMAVAGLAVSLFSTHIDRRMGILLSLVALSIPTALLAVAPNLTVFMVLRIAQGLCMASAFTLTLAYLGEECSEVDAGGAFAAYITGNVASNFIGRLISAAVADHFGLAWNFYFFAAVNLAGAVLVYYTVAQTTPMTPMGPVFNSPFAAWAEHLRNPQLRAAFGIGFCILFAFIGTFTFVNFVLVRPPLSLDPMQLGLVYFVFLPSIVTTLLAGWAVGRIGARRTLWAGLALGRLGPAASPFAQACGCFARHGADRRGYVLRAGHDDRPRQPRRNRRSRRRQRHVSGELLRRRPGWDGSPRSGLRPDRLVGLRCRHRAFPRRRGGSGHALPFASPLVSVGRVLRPPEPPARPPNAHAGELIAV